MNPAPLAEAFARGWAAAYTAWLPREARDRRREELASDVWEHVHEEGHVTGQLALAWTLFGRVVRGIPADLMWSTDERRRTRSYSMNFAMDRQRDQRLILAGNAALTALVCLYAPIVIGLPPLLAVTIPAGVIVVALERRRLQRTTKEVGMMSAADTARTRSRAAIVLAASVVVFVTALYVNTLPGSNTHDAYWVAFVAPMMIAPAVGLVALLMLAWSYLPRRDLS
jgi:hypothetical protein